MDKIKYLSVVLSFSVLASCGGGGGDSSDSRESTDPNTVFPIPLIKEQTPRTHINFSGTDSFNDSVSGMKTNSWGANEVFKADGNSYNYLQGLVTLSVSDGSSTEVESKTYFDSDARYVGSVRTKPTYRECLVVSSNHIPSTIKLGDADTWYSAICNDSTAITSSWKAAASSSRETINLVFIGTLTDSEMSIIKGSTEVTYEINRSGQVVNYSVKIEDLLTPYSYEISSN